MRMSLILYTPIRTQLHTDSKLEVINSKPGHIDSFVSFINNANISIQGLCQGSEYANVYLRKFISFPKPSKIKPSLFPGLQ